MITLYQFAILIIGGSLLSVSACLWVLWLRFQVYIHDAFIILYLSIFIGMCGLNHLVYVVMLYTNIFAFFVLMLCLTAIISIVTAFLLPIIAIRFMKNYLSLSDRLENIQANMKFLERHIKNK